MDPNLQVMMRRVDEDPRKDSESIDQEKNDNVNSTNNVNAASTDMYGCCKNHKKTVKTGQTRTRERKECKRAGSF
ncbi:hypothetical protein Tco_0854991 [Tanacetum coccineum]